MGITQIGDKVIKKSIKSPTPKTKEVKVGRKISKKSVTKRKKKKFKFFRKKSQPKRDIGYGKYAGKEFFAKFGSGLVSQQYINVLFSQIGASYFLIGLFHGLKDLFSIITSIFMQEYLKVRNVERWMINLTGIFLGLSYLLVAIGLFMNSIYFVGIMLIIIGTFSTYLGQVYAKSYVSDIKQKPKLGRFPQYSVFLIGLSLIIGSYILDKFPIHGKLIELGSNFALPGYFLLMSIAAICFIISSQFLKGLIAKQRFEIKTSMWVVIKEHLATISKQAPVLLKNKVILIALIAGTVTGIVQTLGNIYYGLFIYKMFKYMGFGGFTNIAMIFIISIFSALMATTISKMLSKKYGNLPLLTFGTLMVAMQPLIYYFSPNLLAISMATMIGIIGASLSGLAIGLLVIHALAEEERSKYYTVFSFLLTIPYIILIPLGSYFAQVFGLRLLFLVLGLSLIILIIPLYFGLQIALGKQTA